MNSPEKQNRGCPRLPRGYNSLMRHRCLTVAVAILLLGHTSSGAAAQQSPDWTDVGALFADRCTMCHSGSGAPLGLQLDSYEGARAGSQNGPVLIPGNPDDSELVQRIRGEAQPRMPLVGEPLVPAEIEMIEQWVREGLAGPDGAADETASEPPALPETEGVDDGTSRAGNGPVTFADVEPIFLQRCVMCHSDAAPPQRPPEGLRLNTYENILAGGERLAVVPGRPAHSELVRRIEGTARPRMPFNGPPWLSDDEISLIRQWIEEGAANSAGDPAPIPVGREIRLRGTVTSPSSIDQADFTSNEDTRIEDRLVIGQEAEMRGRIAEDGSVRAERIRAR